MMPLTLFDPTSTTDEITDFISQVLTDQKKSVALVAVSGGIDSALALILAVKALGKERVTPVFLPYGDQSMANAQLMTNFVGFDDHQIIEINILPIVEAAADQLKLKEDDHLRLGNLKARSRMMVLFDLAKTHDGLVCGTENKSEHYLGYFTRFGDAAADLEPLQHVYKTQIRQLARHLNLPTQIIQQAPSADLWAGQSDEVELGFSYEQADLVLWQIIEEKKDPSEIDHVEPEVVSLVLKRLEQAAFKQQVPYKIKS